MADAHKHLIIRSETNNTPTDPKFVAEWLTVLVKKIDMKLLGILNPNPTVGYCDVEGNRGLTGVALIETSHVVIHCWDEHKNDPNKGGKGLCQLDIYSCSNFNPYDIVDHFQIFQPTRLSYKYFDRETDLIEIDI